MTDLPSPLEWHPYYRDKTFLLDWLEGRGHLAGPEVRLPVTPPLSHLIRDIGKMTYPAEDFPLPQVRTLTKRKAAGLAPYVGRPFHYEWHVATDDLGRHIAGDSRIVYHDPWRP